MKKLIEDSEKYLIEVNTIEYLEFQKKFDQLYKTIQIEQKALMQLSSELKEHRANFIKKQSTDIRTKDKNLTIKIDTDNEIEADIDKMNTVIENFNSTIESYNFISRF